MRRYIRHSTDIPVKYQIISSITSNKPLRDISLGGLCFRAGHPIHAHTPIHLEIKNSVPEFAAEGTVVWCHPEDGDFSVGVQFDSEISETGLQAIEQLCYIAHYKNHVWEKEGRNLTGEQAANEWLRKYAEVFSPD